MNLLLRALIYGLCLFLVAIVYVGQKHTTAAEILPAAGKTAARLYGWSVVAVVAMLAIEYLFID